MMGWFVVVHSIDDVFVLFALMEAYNPLLVCDVLQLRYENGETCVML